MPSLQIAICTCQRPVMLRSCLVSVLNTRLPDGCSTSIVVIDNDPQQLARPVVDELSAAAPVAIHYVHEPRRGIPVARNKALDFAREYHADYLVFIDDDEEVESDWLTELVAYAESKGGQAVIHGRVISEFPADAPRHLMAFFATKKLKPTGQLLTSCATDNVLIPLRPVFEHGLRFDESRPLAGGTDTIFFCAAHDLGIEIFSCTEAVVRETVPLGRITTRWLSKRKFRAGVDMGQRRIRNGRSLAASAITSILQIILGLLSSGLLLLLIRRHLATKEWLKVCRCAGIVYGSLGYRVDAYKSIEGH